MILGVLQARCSSSRFPKKILAPLGGQPMVLRQLERALRASHLDAILVATSEDPSDDDVQALCAAQEIPCFRGSLDDVLDRVYRAAWKWAPDHVVRLTGDCPLLDPEVLDAVVELHLSGRYDYTSNTLEPTFPDGLDVEVMRFSCLATAWREATLPSEREHVTPFLYKHPERFRLGSLRRSGASLMGLRWTVDEPEDLVFVEKIFSALYPGKPDFSYGDVLDVLREHPEWEQINQGFDRNEGYLRSLRKDEAVLSGEKE